jgi:hypothetical protein
LIHANAAALHLSHQGREAPSPEQHHLVDMLRKLHGINRKCDVHAACSEIWPTPHVALTAGPVASV